MNGIRWTEDDLRAYHARGNRAAVQTPHRKQLVGYEPVGKGKAPALDTPVRIHCHTIGLRLGDPDGRSIKAALDAIVRCGVLKTDDHKSISEISFTQEIGEIDETIITLEVINEAQNP